MGPEYYGHVPRSSSQWDQSKIWWLGKPFGWQFAYDSQVHQPSWVKIDVYIWIGPGQTSNKSKSPTPRALDPKHPHQNTRQWNIPSWWWCGIWPGFREGLFAFGQKSYQETKVDKEQSIVEALISISFLFLLWQILFTSIHDVLAIHQCHQLGLRISVHFLSNILNIIFPYFPP